MGISLKGRFLVKKFGGGIWWIGVVGEKGLGEEDIVESKIEIPQTAFS